MKRPKYAESVLIEEIKQSAEHLRKSSRGLSIGFLIRMIRSQLGMSQAALAKRAHIQQATMSRIEKGEGNTSLSTLNRILDSISCDLVIVPMLREPIDTIRLRQARKKAESHMRYLKGTMNLEEQQPDARFLEGLLKEETERLLQGPDTELWTG